MKLAQRRGVGGVGAITLVPTYARPRRTGAAAKKTVRRKHHDSATKLINASVEKRVAGAAARGGQHFELGTVSDAAKAACAEQRAAGKTSKKARRLEKAAEKAKPRPRPPLPSEDWDARDRWAASTHYPRRAPRRA